MTKVCKRCGIEKPLDEFGINPKMPDERISICKSCRRPSYSFNPRRRELLALHDQTTPDTKVCTACEQIKPLTEFKSSPNGQKDTRSICRDCERPKDIERARQRAAKKKAALAQVANPGMKRCKCCGVEKPLDEFHPNRRAWDGRISICKSCHKPNLHCKSPELRPLIEAAPPGMKVCRVCKTTKPLAEFKPQGKSVRYACNECWKKRCREAARQKPHKSPRVLKVFNRDPALLRRAADYLELPRPDAPKIDLKQYCRTVKRSPEYKHLVEAETPTTKTCAYCLRIKPLDEFQHCDQGEPRKGVKQLCKDCEHLAAGERRLTTDERTTLQNAPCSICGKEPPSVIDHDQRTQVVRGPLCRACIEGLAVLSQDPGRLRDIADHLNQEGNY